MAVQVASKRRVSRFGLIPAGKLERREALWFWFFISPWVVGFIVFTAGPIIASAYVELDAVCAGKRRSLSASITTRPLANDRIFWKSLQVTAYYSLLAVPLGLYLACCWRFC